MSRSAEIIHCQGNPLIPPMMCGARHPNGLLLAVRREGEQSSVCASSVQGEDSRAAGEKERLARI